jgi:hypothetical protein
MSRYGAPRVSLWPHRPHADRPLSIIGIGPLGARPIDTPALMQELDIALPAVSDLLD